MKPLYERLWKKVAIGCADECWPWLGWRHPSGHGQIGRGRRTDGLVYTHVAVWEEINGPVPAGKIIRHSCDNPPCCNPLHLLLGTMADNTADMMARKRTPLGEDRSDHKLTAAEVLAIRASSESCGILAPRYAVSRRLIYKIRKRQICKHI